eukprot:Lankesteria_metandrocarpae@DN2076_c0_g1_i1.p1
MGYYPPPQHSPQPRRHQYYSDDHSKYGLDLYDPYDTPNKPIIQKKCFVCTGLFMSIVGLTLIVVSVMVPSYHFVIIASGLNALSVDVGLWYVQAEGRCENPVLKIKLFDKVCETLVTIMNGRSLGQVEAVACAGEAYTFQFIPTGCDSLTRVRIASYVLLIFLMFAGILYLFGTLLFATFWFIRRTLRFRSASLMLMFVACLLLIAGMVVYLVIGGTNIDLRIPIVALDVVNFDLSTGFLVFIFTVLWSVITPFAYYVAMPKSICWDYTPDDDSGDECEPFTNHHGNQYNNRHNHHGNHGNPGMPSAVQYGNPGTQYGHVH